MGGPTGEGLQGPRVLRLLPKCWPWAPGRGIRGGVGAGSWGVGGKGVGVGVGSGAATVGEGWGGCRGREGVVGKHARDGCMCPACH